MEYLLMAVFLLIWIGGIIVLVFSFYLSYRTRDRIWQNLSLSYLFLTVGLLFLLIQVYLKSSMPFEHLYQMYWFGLHSDVSFLLCLIFPAAFNTILEAPFRKTLKQDIFHSSGCFVNL
jgi:hypothetical protein